MNKSENLLFADSSLASQVHAAAVNGDKGALQRLIAGNSALKDKEDQFGRTPLMYCVLADRLDCADALLKAGADVNKTDHSQRTALHLAAQKRWGFTKLPRLVSNLGSSHLLSSASQSAGITAQSTEKA
ncbi:PREDICTED: inversin-like isoform X1 [Colobus angolensis palliatus]|uniref:inversin-like isoform X1 n=1 Tax=Colobus angolensis palliatus TaxID=336983 RepID=UPI0005F4F163|nr:PREDICTED: inversin-like isoform X1 [Colobus angolensis palliatus]